MKNGIQEFVYSSLFPFLFIIAILSAISGTGPVYDDIIPSPIDEHTAVPDVRHDCNNWLWYGIVMVHIYNYCNLDESWAV
jgi:hypothetical protein